VGQSEGRVAQQGTDPLGSRVGAVRSGCHLASVGAFVDR
jgi:hypothetical protein